MQRKKAGFTMVELLIVVAIIGVLSAVAIPIFNGKIKDSKKVANEANARSLYENLTAYSITHNYKISEEPIRERINENRETKLIDLENNSYEFNNIVERIDVCISPSGKHGVILVQDGETKTWGDTSSCPES